MSLTPPHVGVERSLFRTVMGAFAAGVAIVSTVDARGAPVGLTTSAVSSVSADPPILLVCVDKSSRTLPALRQRRRFVVNFLHRDAVESALVFASKSENKFGAVSWRRTTSGVPVLESDSLAWAECTLDRELPVGDHAVLFGLVVGGAAAEASEPLVYHRRKFGDFAPC